MWYRPPFNALMLWTLLSVLALWPNPSPAEGHDACLPPADLLRTLTLWIGAQTDYDVSTTLNTPPEIAFCVSGDTIDYENTQLLVDDDLNAAYDAAARQIILVEPWSGSDLRDQSILLHELVHDVQLQNRTWACPAAPEWEAYKLQDAWLAEHGIDSGFDWLWVYMQSRCPRDIHPD